MGSRWRPQIGQHWCCPKLLCPKTIHTNMPVLPCFAERQTRQITGTAFTSPKYDETGYWTRDLSHSKQMLWHWTIAAVKHFSLARTCTYLPCWEDVHNLIKAVVGTLVPSFHYIDQLNVYTLVYWGWINTYLCVSQTPPDCDRDRIFPLYELSLRTEWICHIKPIYPGITWNANPRLCKLDPVCVHFDVSRSAQPQNIRYCTYTATIYIDSIMKIFMISPVSENR